MSNILSEEDYIALAVADFVSDETVAPVLNKNGCANWTVCPQCHIDDFTHVEGCRIGAKVDEVIAGI